MRRLGLVCGLGALFVWGLVALSGCGPLEEETCVTNDDCSSTEVCHNASAQCVVQCTDDETVCTPDEQCTEEGISGTEKGCVEESSGTDAGTDTGGTDAMNDVGVDGGGDGCELGDCPQNEVCNDETGMCESQINYKYIQVKDTSGNECDSQSPGADLFAAELTDADGENLGYGFAETANITGDNNNAEDGPQVDAVFSGEAPPNFTPDDRAGYCPDGFKVSNDTNVIPVGCDGSVVLSFHDENGEEVALEEGHQIHIWEYGAQCSDPDGDDDQTMVSICTAQTASGEIVGRGVDENNNHETCDTGEAFSGFGQYSDTISSLPESDDGS